MSGQSGLCLSQTSKLLDREHENGIQATATKHFHLKVTCAICISLVPTSPVATPEFKEAEKSGLTVENQNILLHPQMFLVWCPQWNNNFLSPLSPQRKSSQEAHYIKWVELKPISLKWEVVTSPFCGNIFTVDNRWAWGYRAYQSSGSFKFSRQRSMRY